MPILNKEIEIKVPKRGKNIKVFNQLEIINGYVKINQIDLVNLIHYEMHINIECICDKCGKHFTRRLGILDKNNILCQHCITKKTNRLKYGVDVPIQNKNIYKKIKNTLYEKYGVDNPMKSQIIQEKTRKTCIKKYGVEYCVQSKEVRKKIEESCLKKYGFKTSLQNKEVNEKARQTCLKKYGVDNPSKNKKIQEKRKQTMKLKYGVEYSVQNNDLKNKQIKTNIKKYGTNNPLKNKIVREKIKNTMIEKYGVDNPLKNKEIQKKQIQTNLLKYGYKYPLELAKNRACTKIGKVPCSKQQKHIAELIHGQINVPINKYVLDILKENINIEYDGGGHRLNVKFGKLTNEEFDELQNKRDNFLIDNGFKIIRIVCTNDKIPSDDIIIEQLNKAFLELRNTDFLIINW